MKAVDETVYFAPVTGCQRLREFDWVVYGYFLYILSSAMYLVQVLSRLASYFSLISNCSSSYQTLIINDHAVVVTGLEPLPPDVYK